MYSYIHVSIFWNIYIYTVCVHTNIRYKTKHTTTLTYSKINQLSMATIFGHHCQIVSSEMHYLGENVPWYNIQSYHHPTSMIHHPCLKSFPTYPTLQSAHGHKFQPLPGPRLESLIHTGRGKDGMLILWKPDAFGRVVVVVRVVLVAGCGSDISCGGCSSCGLRRTPS